MLDWMNDPVVVPLNQAFPQLGEVTEYRSKQCIFSSDRKKLFAVAGKNYQPVPHRILVRGIEDAITSAGAHFSERKVVTSNGGSRMVMWATMDDVNPVAPKKGDVVKWQIRATNSYDLTWKLDVRLVGLQLVCTNGLTVGRDIASISSKHFKGTIGPDLEIMSSGIQEIANKSTEVGKSWKEWAGKTVEYATVKRVMEKHAAWIPKKHAEYILGQKYPCSLWDLYSHFTYAATHMTNSINRRIELDERVSQLFYAETAVDA